MDFLLNICKTFAQYEKSFIFALTINLTLIIYNYEQI